MYDFFRQFDDYCERTDFSFLSEPLNYFSNLWFWVAAFMAFRELQRSPVARSFVLRGLVLLLVLVGLGSGFFHSYATGWAKICDVGFIGAFVLWFLWFWLKDALGLSFGKTLAIYLSFFVVTVILQMSFASLPVNGSQGYFGVAVYLLGIGLHARSKPLISAGCIFIVSLIFRTLDQSLCATIPFGTHFVWHTLNALLCYLTIRGMREEMEEEIWR